MPVSLGEWRVRIGTFMPRRRKVYDYHYFWRKLHYLIKKNKNAEPPKENNNPECNISSRTGSSLDVNSSPGNSVRRPASSYHVNLNTAQTGPSCDVNKGRGNANSPTLSQFDVPERDTVKESGSPCDGNNPDNNDFSHSESSCAENSGSLTANEINLVPDTTDVQIPVPRPCVDDELDNRRITINRVPHEYPTNSAQISKIDQPEVGTSESYSHVSAVVPGETECIKLDKEKTSDSRPSGIEDQSSDLSPKHRLESTRNIDERTSSIKEITENCGSSTYPVLQSGTTNGEADVNTGNDCSNMNNILLLRSGDVERNPGPNNNPGSLTELELYLLADGMDLSDFRKIGLALGFHEARLSRFERDRLGNSMQASYQMLYEWRKTVQESKAREILVNTLERIQLVQLADSLRKGQVGDHIPSMTEEEIQLVAEEVKEYLAIHLCQIQADPLNSELVLEFKRIYTNLTLMEEDKGTKRKTPLLYDNLLRTKVNGIYPKRLLVEGEGGVGKTTFCAKIAWDWIHGNGYLDFKLVLVILLRKAENKTVGEIVKSYLSDNNPVTAKQLDKHILSNPKDVFLVLDGLDELAVDLNSNQQIIMITLNKLFMSGKVLITSRQWKSDDIRNNAFLRKVFAFIAVEGFSAENLSSYITKFFHPDTTSSEDLNRFISNNDVIRENMAPYPLYTAMLCIMWKEFGRERREAMSKLQTFSQLFNEMIDFLVDHYLSKHIPSGIDKGKLRENRSHIRHHLLQIGHIAFQGLVGRRLVFREDEFQSYPESIDVGCNVGVLTREKQIIPRRDRRDNPNSEAQSVQFPHKLFQEYLSGIYIASLYNSNRDEYDKLIANIIRKAVEYRYLLYITSAQQKEVGLDIVSRLIASKTGNQPFGSDEDGGFIVDVAYESQDQAVAKVVADHVSTESRKTLKIAEYMQAHTLSGHFFIMNHREVDHLIIEKPCGRTASEDLADFICSSRSPRSVTIASSMHDVFYSVLANKAVDSKIETLTIHSLDLSKRPSASRDLVQFICKMPRLKCLTIGDVNTGKGPKASQSRDFMPKGRLNDNLYSTSSSIASSAKPKVWLHDNFYSTSSSIASSAKIETLCIHSWVLIERPSASRDLAQFICKLAHLKALTLDGQYHDDFYSTSSSKASSAKIETLNIGSSDLRKHPSASHYLAQFICKMPHLKNLKIGGRHDWCMVWLHDDFYTKSLSEASSTKIETLCIHSWDLIERPSASRDLAQFICKLAHLKALTLDGQYHDDFYSASSSEASSAKIETLHISCIGLSERLSASRNLAQFICKMPHLKALTLDGPYHDDFYSTSLSMASSQKIETLDILSGLSQRPSASRNIAQFICKMPRLKNLALGGQYHDDFYSASSSIASSVKIETLVIWSDGLRQRRSASRDLAQFTCNLPHLKNLKLGGQYHDDFYSTLSSMASSAKSVLEDEQTGNTSSSLTELTVGGDTLEGWQDCGSMFDNVKRVTIQVQSTINYGVIQRINLPAATELTIQTHEYVRPPAGFHEEPTSLPNALLNISPQLVKVTFSDLDIGNSKMEQILLAFRSPHNLKHLKIIRFIRCGTDESVDDITTAYNKDQVMEVEVEHGEPRGSIKSLFVR